MTDRDENILTHLKALRAVLIHCLSAVGLLLVPMLFVAPYCIDFLISAMLRGNDIQLNFFAPMEVFMLELKTALVLDLLVSFPYVALQFWRFIVPALYERERRFVRSLVLISGVLFVLGVMFCLFVILPMVIAFGLSFAHTNIQAVLGLADTVSLALWLSVIFGLMFQFPLITYALVKSDIVSFADVKSKRAYVFVGILIMSALLTPPDIISQMMLTLPTYLLFESGLFLARPSKKIKNTLFKTDIV